MHKKDASERHNRANWKQASGVPHRVALGNNQSHVCTTLKRHKWGSNKSFCWAFSGGNVGFVFVFLLINKGTITTTGIHSYFRKKKKKRWKKIDIFDLNRNTSQWNAVGKRLFALALMVDGRSDCDAGTYEGLSSTGNENEILNEN